MAGQNGSGAERIEADVAVVGAGLSGLACARRLHEAGASVAVLEARDRVGGRTLNARLGAGKIVEVGGQWVGPGHERVRALAAEVGVGTFPTHIQGDHLYSRHGRTSRYRADVPPRTPAGLADYRLAQARLERMVRRVDLGSAGGRPARGPTRRADARILDRASHAHPLRPGLDAARG